MEKKEALFTITRTKNKEEASLVITKNGKVGKKLRIMFPESVQTWKKHFKECGFIVTVIHK